MEVESQNAGGAAESQPSYHDAAGEGWSGPSYHDTAEQGWSGLCLHSQLLAQPAVALPGLKDSTQQRWSILTSVLREPGSGFGLGEVFIVLLLGNPGSGLDGGVVCSVAF